MNLGFWNHKVEKLILTSLNCSLLAGLGFSLQTQRNRYPQWHHPFQHPWGEELLFFSARGTNQRAVTGVLAHILLCLATRSKGRSLGYGPSSMGQKIEPWSLAIWRPLSSVILSCEAIPQRMMRWEHKYKYKEGEAMLNTSTEKCSLQRAERKKITKLISTNPPYNHTP